MQVCRWMDVMGAGPGSSHGWPVQYAQLWADGKKTEKTNMCRHRKGKSTCAPHRSDTARQGGHQGRPPARSTQVGGGGGVQGMEVTHFPPHAAVQFSARVSSMSAL